MVSLSFQKQLEAEQFISLEQLKSISLEQLKHFSRPIDFRYFFPLLFPLCFYLLLRLNL
jgi:hypothetical protein